jgi:hypothetical protein
VQYLVFIHNHAGAGLQSTAGVCDGDTPQADKPDGMSSYARVLVDVLEPDPLRAIRNTVAESLEFPREHGESVFHMTSTTSLDMVLETGFDDPAHITQALIEAWERGADARKSA